VREPGLLGVFMKMVNGKSCATEIICTDPGSHGTPFAVTREHVHPIESSEIEVTDRDFDDNLKRKSSAGDSSISDARMERDRESSSDTVKCCESWPLRCSRHRSAVAMAATSSNWRGIPRIMKVQSKNVGLSRHKPWATLAMRQYNTVVRAGPWSAPWDFSWRSEEKVAIRPIRRSDQADCLT